MIQGLFFTYLGVSTLLALNNWRLGIYLMIVAGVLQDPVRKMMPNAPGYMVLAFVPVFFAVCAGLFRNGQPWQRFVETNPAMFPRIMFFLFSLGLAFFVLLINYGLLAWKAGVIGLIGYLFPLIAVAAGFWFFNSAAAIKRFILFYCCVSAVLLIGGPLEHWNVFPDWPALGTEVLGMEWIRQVPGYAVSLTSGFFRSPDVLGWHAALLVMFAATMTLISRNPFARATWIVFLAWGLVVLLMSGRNKMIFMPAVFLGVVVLGYLSRGYVNRSFTIVLATLLGLGLFWMINAQIQLDREYFRYVEAGTVAAPERLKTHGLLAVWGTYKQSGFFGEGLGSASTGARFGGVEAVRSWQESGSSKLMVELGVIGFVAVLMLGLTLVKWLLRLLRTMPAGAEDSMLFTGLLGILAANASSFLVSHQVFGDPFIVTLTGFLLGTALSAPRWLVVRQPTPSASLVAPTFRRSVGRPPKHSSR